MKWWPEMMCLLIMIAVCGLIADSNPADTIVPIDGSGHLFRDSMVYVGAAVVFWAASFAFGIIQGLRAQRLPAKVGIETMMGKTIKALTNIDPKGGKVLVEGEYWNAMSDTAIDQGNPVQIVAVEGLTLRVRPAIGEWETRRA